MPTHLQKIPGRIVSEHLCECGCGQFTSIVKLTRSDRGIKAGEPRKFMPGHNSLIHGYARGRSYAELTPEFNAYKGAQDRCTRNVNSIHWKNYAGRGIRFLYKDFTEFLADVGHKPSPKHTLDRMDNNGNYEPGNCRWITHKEQTLNRRGSRNVKTGRYEVTTCLSR